MNSLISYPAHVAALKPYVPGLPISAVAARSGIAQDRIVKLASNENPLGASPKALDALSRAAIDLSRYPDSDCAALSDAIAEFHGVPRDWIVVGAGSESVLGNLVSTLLQPGRSTVYSQYSFQAFVNAAQKLGASSMVVPSPDFSVDLDGLADAIQPSTALVYIANPGNPTGTVVEPGALKAFLERVPAHVVVLLDEAYFEFMPAALRGDSIAWVREHPNLVVTRTFSKAYGLAGLRIGYGIAQSGLADVMRRVRSPFTISDAAQVAAIAALEDVEFIERTVAMTNEGRKALTSGLSEKGYRCVESHTNFVLAAVDGGAAFASKLEKHGLIVRPVTSYGLADWVRVSIGTPAEIDRFLAAL
ncbi:histidinol-phosphate transaminase [Variovorax sp. YR216]|uniref:histidinol-phosphate transaminase n=1 Tax=Variovorax sp. YR216 TaxID=1882828 RepID=UPI00089C7DBA|nr:histidinol-phosphate transaminase [Variovorax sp. YR216]SEB24931.1 histidinol-phosphate aminotransferase [Variovorax sp. YR216]